MRSGQSSILLPVLAAAAALTAAAQTLPTLRVTDEIAPPGGMAQMKVLLTSPKPILMGDAFIDLSGLMFTSIDGIEMFSNTGDVMGAAVLNPAGFSLKIYSPNGTFGTNVDYPIVTAAVRIASTATVGSVTPVNFDLTGLGLPAGTFEIKPGSVTIGGSVSITNVIPGSGFLPAGTSFRLEGVGFDPKMKVKVKNQIVASQKFVSSTEMELKLAADAYLDGAEIIVKNPDGSMDDYFSYLRGIPVGKTSWPLLARTVPIFPMNPAYEAILPATVSQVNANYFTALALQNAGQAGASVTVELHTSSGALLGKTQFSLSAMNKIQRELSEWFGSAASTVGSYVRIVSDRPVQVMGLLGDLANAVVQPAAVTVVNAPPPIVLPSPPPGA